MGSKVLLVDDAAFMRMLLRNILSPQGYEIAGEAQNGEEAVNKYKELKPDLVTMDIIMPGMDGIEAVKNIVKENPNANIVMCTAIGQESMVKEALMAGAKGYIIKPFQAPKVLEEVGKILG